MRDPDFLGCLAPVNPFAPETPRENWRAWRSNFQSPDPKHAASLVQYLLYCPAAHMAWSYWGFALVHLRDLPGVPPAAIRRAGATHEILIGALDPRCPYDPDQPLGWAQLQPLDVVEQFQVPNDDYARQLALLCVRYTMDGQISPDQDYRRAWSEVIQTTARHFREGKHPIQ